MAERHAYHSITVRRHFEAALAHAKNHIDGMCRGSFADRPTRRREVPLERVVEGVFEVWWDVIHVVESTYVRELLLQRTRDVVDVQGRRVQLDFIVDVMRPSRDGAAVFPKIGVAIGRHHPTDADAQSVIPWPEYPDFDQPRLAADAGWQIFEFNAAEVMTMPVRCVDLVQTFGELAAMDYLGV